MNPSRSTVATVCLIAGAMLLYAVFGSPSYGYFGFMKLVVVGSAGFVAWALYQFNAKLIPLSIILAALGGMEFFGKMQREQWVPWNLATAGTFALSALLAGLLKPKVDNVEEVA